MMASPLSATKPCVSALSKKSNGPVKPLTVAHLAHCAGSRYAMAAAWASI